MPSPLADFTARLLTRHGALVEQDQNEIVALLPPPLASVLEVAEYQRFTFDSRVAARQGLAVDYDSPLVDRFERLVGALGRVACVPAPRLPLKAIDPEEVVTGALTVTNGIIRDCRAESSRAEYVGFFVQYELLADERISGLTDVWVNATTRSAPRLHGFATRLLSPQEGWSDVRAEGAAFDDVLGIAAEAWTSGAAFARSAVEGRLLDAVASLRRRRERDFARLREYYDAIDEEVRRRARRAVAKGRRGGREGRHLTARGDGTRVPGPRSGSPRSIPSTRAPRATRGRCLHAPRPSRDRTGLPAIDQPNDRARVEPRRSHARTSVLRGVRHRRVCGGLV